MPANFWWWMGGLLVVLLLANIINSALNALFVDNMSAKISERMAA